MDRRKASKMPGSAAKPSSKMPDQLDLTRLALKASLTLPVVKSLTDSLTQDPYRAQSITAFKEIECARRFNFDLSENLPEAVQQIEAAVHALTQCDAQLILLFNETTGLYECLNDKAFKTQEFAHLKEAQLKTLLGVEKINTVQLFAHEDFVGVLALGYQRNNIPDPLSEIIMPLDVLAPYLAIKIRSLKTARHVQNLNDVQHCVQEISTQLIRAADYQAVLFTMLSAFHQLLKFDICQYVVLDPNCGEGHVLIEQDGDTLNTYMNPGQETRRPKMGTEIASLVSLFTSMGRKEPYLHINGPRLGDKPLNQVFQVKHLPRGSQIQSALVLPVLDMTPGRGPFGKIQGVFILCRTSSEPISEDVLNIAKEVIHNVSLALGRAYVLEKALEMAHTDELTGLTNRRGFYERFESEIERARRNPASLCVVMVDVDFFKRLNDSFGHLIGDQVLCRLADLFHSNVRRSDVVARFGGEEFALLLPDTTLTSATELMERIRREVQQVVCRGMSGEPVQFTISAGIAQIDPTHGLSKPSREVISEALAYADEQLYLAKESGRNRVCATCSKTE